MPTRSYTALGTFYLNIPNTPGIGLAGTYVVRSIRANGGAADYWLQLHASLPSQTGTLPADGAIPATTPLLVPMNYLSEMILPDGLIINGAIVAMMSSTRDTLTKVTGAVTDISVEVDEFQPNYDFASLFATGDYTTSVKQKQVWAESAGPKSLMELHLTNSTGGTIYAQLFADDAPADGSVPLFSWPISASSSVVVSFGINAGRSPYRQDADGTAHRGCTIFFSSTQNTKTLVAANSGTIKAFYR